MKLGMSSLVELLALHDRRREESEKQRLKEAVKEALAETRSGEIVEVHKRGTVNGQEVDVHETHRRRGAGEIEVRKDGTVGGQAVNAVEVHRRGAA
jgi:hypothetical protein